MNKTKSVWTAALLMVSVAGGTALAQSGGSGATSQPNRAQQAQERKPLKVGDLAPTFALASLDGKKLTDIKSFRGKKPVLLFFGSYT